MAVLGSCGVNWTSRNQPPSLVSAGILAFYPLLISVSSYLENEGQDALIRPWVWLVIIGLGPWLMGVFGEMHNYYGVRNEWLGR